MNTEDKKKAMLADDLTNYVRDKHTQEECIGFIDGYNAALTKLKLLGIGGVVQRSEQLPTCEHDNYEKYSGWGGQDCFICKDCGHIW